MKASRKLLQALPRRSIDRFSGYVKAKDLYETGRQPNSTPMSYLEQRPLDGTTVISGKNEMHNGEELLKNIDLFRNYAILASYSSQKELADDFSKRALRSSDQLSQMLAALNNAIKSPAPDPDNLASKLSLPSNSSVAGKTLQALQIKDNDPDSARKISKQIFHEIMASKGMRGILTDADLGMVVSPVQLFNLLLDLDLVQEAAQCAERLSNYNPQRRMAAQRAR